MKGLVLGAMLCAVAAPALAGDAAVGSLAIQNAWARASAGQARNGAAFLTIVNKGAAADTLVSAAAGVSKTVELHTHIKEGEVMKMRPVESIAVPAGGTVELKPGGDHVMFIGLTQALTQGGSFPLTLTFAKAGEVKVTVDIQGVGAMGMSGTMDHGHMKH